MIRSKPCKFVQDDGTACGSIFHTAMYHKPRKQIVSKKRPAQQSDKEKEYQRFKEEVLRPALIARDGNFCCCCGRPAYPGEKLDIEHTISKGSRADLKRDLNNLTLMCRFPCHYRKTNRLPCLH